jgi:transitional endoplasmic reticulum ATPase
MERNDASLEDVKEQLVEFNELAEKEGMKRALKLTKEKLEAQEQIIDFNYTFKCFQHEGAYAIHSAVEKVLGSTAMNNSGASGNKPPEVMVVKLPNGGEVKVPWGQISLSSFSDESYIELDYDWDDVELTVRCRVPKNLEGKIKEIMDVAGEEIKTNSIYRGQAISLEFDHNNEVDEPDFMDLNTIDENKILFSKQIDDGLVPILARVKNTEACIAQGLDIKLGVLMEGPYGTGKTLTAFWLGKVAKEHGWTFIYLKNCHNTGKALKIAENYAHNGTGVILFTEDIDQAVRGDRGQKIQDIVNTLDGGDTKNLPIISIFTTNHIELIEPTLLRGKRIGSLIHLGELDEDTAEQFIDKLVVDKNDKSLMEEGDHTPAIKALCGIVPAFASEIIDKAKAYMVHRGGTKISNDDIVTAAKSYKDQMEYAVCKKKEAKTDLEAALRIIYRAQLGNPNKPQEAIKAMLTQIDG